MLFQIANIYISKRCEIEIVACFDLLETEYEGHSHMTFAIVEKSLDGGFSLKALKQKQMVDGLCYLLQEVYGIENKNLQRSRVRELFADLSDLMLHFHVFSFQMFLVSCLG